MRAVRAKNTSPELVVRRLAHALGFRFRLHRRDLPGNPDIVFPRLRKAVLVHGCFWHGHDCPRGARTPKANRDYWVAKIARNRARDMASLRSLQEAGWKPLVVWECEMKDREQLKQRLAEFLRD